MAKRTARPATPTTSAQPDPAPGSAMTEPTPPPAAPETPAQPDTELVAAASAVPDSAAAPAITPGAWPDASGPEVGPHCPWCSAPLASNDLETCPACGAQLNAAADGDVPGVTTIDVAALAYKAGSPPKRSRILSWISGDDAAPAADTSGTSSAAVEPPSLAVRREILRLELEAEGISLPHDAEPSGADEAAAVAEATPDPTSANAGSSEPTGS
jgi:hypothetical protein